MSEQPYDFEADEARTLRDENADYGSDRQPTRLEAARDERGSADVFGCGLFLMIALAVLALAGLVGFHIYSATQTSTRTCTVVDKDRTSKPKGGSDMRVYTRDCGVLSVNDSVLSGTWHSSDTYASIRKGHRYEFQLRGVRVPFFSMFPNIVAATEVHE